MGTDRDEDKDIIENGFSQMQGKWNLLETNTVTKALSLVVTLSAIREWGVSKTLSKVLPLLCAKSAVK